MAYNNNHNPNVRGNAASFVAVDRDDKKSQNKFCWFKKNNIHYIDYKDPDFLLRFVNDQGKMYPRRITGTSLKFQRRLGKSIKKARHMALLPYVADSLK